MCDTIDSELAIAKVGDKQVKIKGALSTSLAQILNYAYSDPDEIKAKSSIVSLEDGFLQVITSYLEDKEEPMIFVTDSDLSDNEIKDSLDYNPDESVLITVSHQSNDLDTLRDYQDNRMALEEYALDKGVRVFRAIAFRGEDNE